MIKRLLILLLIAPTILSCTERIDIETDNNIPHLVITGLITTENTQHQIYVSSSVQYIGNQPTKYFMDAIVKLNDTLLIADSSTMSYHTWMFAGQSGKTYKLDVWIDFDKDGVDEHYSSTTTMPPMVQLDSIYLGAMSSLYPLGPPWMLFMAFQDPMGANYYGADLWVNQFHFSSSLMHYMAVDLDTPEKDGIYTYYPCYYIEQKLRYGDDYYYFHPFDTLTLKFNSLSSEYFEFIEAAQKEIDGGGNPLFGGPPANVPSNISNGALGIFGSYTISTKQVVLPQTPDFTE